MFTPWITVNKKAEPTYLNKGTKGLVIRTFDGNLFFSSGDSVYALEEIPSHERYSRNFDFTPEIKQSKKVYIPALSHPWRRSNFATHMRKQVHRNISQVV